MPRERKTARHPGTASRHTSRAPACVQRVRRSSTWTHHATSRVHTSGRHSINWPFSTPIMQNSTRPNLQVTEDLFAKALRNALQLVTICRQSTPIWPPCSTLGTRYRRTPVRRSLPSSRPFRGGNRQIRTTPPPLARGVTPVIAWSGEGGRLLGRVQRRDVPDLQRVVIAAAHSACTPAPLVAAPLAPGGPTLPLRSPGLTPPPAAYLMELRSTRKPRLMFRYSGESALR